MLHSQSIEVAKDVTTYIECVCRLKQTDVGEGIHHFSFDIVLVLTDTKSAKNVSCVKC